MKDQNVTNKNVTDNQGKKLKEVDLQMIHLLEVADMDLKITAINMHIN